MRVTQESDVGKMQVAAEGFERSSSHVTKKTFCDGIPRSDIYPD